MSVLALVVLGLISGAESQCDTAGAALGTKVVGEACKDDRIETEFSDCYAGLDPTNFGNCFAVADCYPNCDDELGASGLNWDYEKTHAYNCAMDPYSEMPICLHCCSDTDHTNPGEQIEERWNMVCPIQTNMQRSLLNNEFYKKFEFRFVVQSPDNAEKLNEVRCALGRTGCSYMYDTGSSISYSMIDKTTGVDTPLSCNMADGDYGFCNGTDLVTCTCSIPGSQSPKKFDRPRLGIDDDNDPDTTAADYVGAACGHNLVHKRANQMYLTEVTLTLDLIMYADIFGNTWRSVSACSASTTELSTIGLNDNLKQNVIMRVVEGPNPWLTYAVLCLIIAIFSFFVCISCLIRWRRDKVCGTCTRRLIFGRDQCLICQWLGVQPPDLVLLSRLRDRGQRVVGPGHYQSSGFRYVPEAPPKVKEMQTKYVQPVQQKMIASANDLTVAYANVKRQTAAPAARIARAWRRVRGLPPRLAKPARVHVLEQSKFDQVANQFGSVSETWKERSRSKRVMEQNTRVLNDREKHIRAYEKSRTQNSVRTAPVGSKH